MKKFVIGSLLTLLIPVGYTLAQPVPSRQPVIPILYEDTHNQSPQNIGGTA